MRIETAPGRRGDTTALDLIAIIAAVVVVVGVFLLPASAPARMRTSKINCINNVKQIGLAFRLWAGDNGDKYPMQVSTNLGGTLELVNSGAVWPHFAVMSNELSTPKILYCPNDSQRVMTSLFTGLSDTNLSYFVVPEADETLPQMWLAGDRNLAANNVPLKSGVFVFKASKLVSWTAEMHNNQGNLGFADGSAQQISNARLQQSATNALRAYYEATTNTSFRILIP
jgi:prepilin-type processing-associated H-X9-DG protein